MFNKCWFQIWIIKLVLKDVVFTNRLNIFTSIVYSFRRICAIHLEPISLYSKKPYFVVEMWSSFFYWSSISSPWGSFMSLFVLFFPLTQTSNGWIPSSKVVSNFWVHRPQPAFLCDPKENVKVQYWHHKKQCVLNNDYFKDELSTNKWCNENRLKFEQRGHRFSGQSFFEDTCSWNDELVEEIVEKLTDVPLGSTAPHLPYVSQCEQESFLAADMVYVTSTGCWKQATPSDFLKPYFL